MMEGHNPEEFPPALPEEQESGEQEEVTAEEVINLHRALKK
jgi:hypothetical protein